MYAAAHSGSGNHGVFISSKCLFLVRNSTSVSVDVSEAIPLVGGELHPVAAIAWWAQWALGYPQPHIPAMGRAVALPDSPLAKKLRRMDRVGSFAKYASFVGVAMRFLAEYRSGAVYRCSLESRDTVIKTCREFSSLGSSRQDTP
ncbi:hypothetical protein H4S06_002797 [Coemansia sp. BCRC 34490]|nr:hypothetical protein H4S06_002797 [Coemansia sp. BCRC 34490]